MIEVSGQLTAEDLRQLAKAGIKSVVNNRPDHEAPDQPTSEALAQVCKELGLAYVHIPFQGGMMTQEHVQAFADFYNSAAKPVQVFCRSGNRSQGLIHAAQQMDLLDDA